MKIVIFTIFALLLAIFGSCAAGSKPATNVDSKGGAGVVQNGYLNAANLAAVGATGTKNAGKISAGPGGDTNLKTRGGGGLKNTNDAATLADNIAAVAGEGLKNKKSGKIGV